MFPKRIPQKYHKDAPVCLHLYQAVATLRSHISAGLSEHSHSGHSGIYLSNN